MSAWWRRRPRTGILFLAVLAAAALFAFRSIWISFQTPVVVRTNADTEVLRLATGASEPPAWFITGATIGIDTGVVADTAGQVVPLPGSVIRIERVGTGPVRVSITAGAGGEAARFTTADERASTVALEWLEFDLPADGSRPFNVPIRGTLVLGELSGAQTREGGPMLLGGSAWLVERTWITRKRYETELPPLFPGDEVEVAPRGDSVAAGTGFLRAGGDPGMQVTFTTQGKGLRTRHPGAEDGEIGGVSAWRRLVMDPVAALAASLSLILASAAAPKALEWLGARWKRTADKP